VLASQRQRMLDGMVEAVAEKGYAAATVADAIGRAGVSRSTFYEQFRNKEDCFLAAYESAAQAQLEHVAVTGRQTEGGWLERLKASDRAYLEVLANQPDYARVFLVESGAAGPAAIERRIHVQGRYVDLLRTWYGNACRELGGRAPLPDDVFWASVAATNDLVTRRMRRGPASQLLEMEPIVLYTQLALFGLLEVADVALPSRRTG
jgi:AcrR family transcriptional regulator